jgi:hypothetical protein
MAAPNTYPTRRVRDEAATQTPVSGRPRLASEHSYAKRARLRPGPRRLLLTLITLGAVCIALAVQAPVAGASSSFPSLTPDVAVVPFANDVFWFTNGALTVVDPASTPASAPLFNQEGNPLHLTWGQFSSPTAKSYAWTDRFGGVTHTDFAIGMSGLIPNGVYSLFYRTFGPDSNNAFCPDVEPAVALTSAFPQFQKPDADSFLASSSGKALFIGRVPGNLLAATQLQVSVIYHFDGKTYGPAANQAESQGPSASNGGRCQSSYGIDAMRQLVIIQK